MDRSSSARQTVTAGLLLVMLACVLVIAVSPRPVRAQGAGSGDVPMRLEGYVKLMEPGHWLVGDTRVLLTGQTVVIEKRGLAEVGAWVVVQGRLMPDGSLKAEFIIIERPPSRYGIVWPFSGILKKQAGEFWVIGDVLVRVTAETSISGAPAPGGLVWVMAEQPSDQLEPRAIAIEAIADDPGQVPVQFEGLLEANEPEWRVDGHTFRLTEQAVRIGEPVIGQPVEVEASIQPDGTLVAHLIRAVDNSADAQLSALVAGITWEPNGEQVWDLVVFPATAWAEPYIGTARVGANTLVDESRAIAQPGQWAEVQGISVGQNEYYADVIRLDQPVPAVATGELRLAGAPGALKQNAPGYWTVDGTPIWIDNTHTAAQLAGMAEGEVVVRGVRLGNGVLRAERITPVTGTMR